MLLVCFICLQRVLHLIVRMKTRREKIGLVRKALGAADTNNDKVIGFSEWRDDLKK